MSLQAMMSIALIEVNRFQIGNEFPKRITVLRIDRPAKKPRHRYVFVATLRSMYKRAQGALKRIPDDLHSPVSGGVVGKVLD